MKLRIRSTHRPALVTTPTRNKTLIVGGTITHVNGEEWNHAYCAVTPGGRITFDDIVWESALSEAATYFDTPKVHTVIGSRGDTYTVRETQPNVFTCDCPHYTYRKQQCKHIKEIQHGPQ